MKYLLVIALLIQSLSPLNAFPERRHRKAVEADFRSGDYVQIANRSDASLDALVKFALYKLKKHDREKAFQFESEWESKFQGTLTRYVDKRLAGVRDLGDYKPLSDWLAVLYYTLVVIYGEQTVKFLHLDDINIFNYAVPVVFAMHDILGQNVKISEDEYKKHFVPFAGVVTYWGIFIACEVVTYSAGWTLICTPAGMGGEYIMVKAVAPNLSPKVYPIFWKPKSINSRKY